MQNGAFKLEIGYKISLEDSVKDDKVTRLSQTPIDMET